MIHKCRQPRMQKADKLLRRMCWLSNFHRDEWGSVLFFWSSASLFTGARPENWCRCQRDRAFTRRERPRTRSDTFSFNIGYNCSTFPSLRQKSTSSLSLSLFSFKGNYVAIVCGGNAEDADGLKLIRELWACWGKRIMFLGKCAFPILLCQYCF